jgi:hypothetical protein
LSETYRRLTKGVLITLFKKKSWKNGGKFSCC